MRLPTDALLRLVWPHLALTIAGMVALDYVAFVARFGQAMLASYLGLQVLAGTAGFAIGLFARLRPELEPLTRPAARGASLFPLYTAGVSGARWALSSMEDSHEIGNRE